MECAPTGRFGGQSQAIPLCKVTERRDQPSQINLFWCEFVYKGLHVHPLTCFASGLKPCRSNFPQLQFSVPFVLRQQSPTLVTFAGRSACNSLVDKTSGYKFDFSDTPWHPTRDRPSTKK